MALNLRKFNLFSACVCLALSLGAGGCKKDTSVKVTNGPEATDNDPLPTCDQGAKAPGKYGPQMRHVGRLGGGCFWMDRTEVTRADYQAFLDYLAKIGAPSDSANVQVCRGANDSFAPSKDVDLSQGTLPIVGVDWCDAAAYCRWAGKRLCGTYDYKDQVVSEYMSVCTDGDHKDFDFNALTDSHVCQGDGASEPVAVGSMPKCKSPTGVMDLVGNVAEWTGECKGDDMKDTCAVRGGAYDSTGTSWGCEVKRSMKRTTALPNVGFRCCADES